MTSVLYAVGSGSALASDGTWLLTDAPPTAPVVRDLWARLDAGLGRADILPALSDAGLAHEWSLALVLTGAPALVVVHGEARVLLDEPGGQVVVSGATSSAWTETALPAGTTAATLLLTAAGAAADAQIPALAGVFPSSMLVVRWAPAPPTVPATPPPTMRPPVVPPRPVTAPPVVPPVPSAPPPTSEAVEEPTEVLATPLSARPGPGHGVLLISTGEQIVLDRGAVLGRSPEWHGSDDRRLVTVVGRFGDISRSHVGVSLDGERVQVEDLGSTNGTLVTEPGGPQHLLQVGVAETLEPGAVVTLSRDVSFTWETEPR